MGTFSLFRLKKSQKPKHFSRSYERFQAANCTSLNQLDTKNAQKYLFSVPFSFQQFNRNRRHMDRATVLKFWEALEK